MCGKHCEATSNQRHRTYNASSSASLNAVAAAKSQARDYTDVKVHEVKQRLGHERAQRERELTRDSHVRFVERILFIALGLVIEITLDQFFVLPVILAKLIIIAPEVARETFELIKRL